MSLPPALLWYRGLTWLAAPALPAVLARRARKGKEDAARRSERLGRAGTPRPGGVLVWMHGASVGESLVLASLADGLLEIRPELNILVTTGTVTSADILARRLPPRAFHQYVPVDTPGATARFLDHWKPDLAVFAESELWPNLIAGTARRKIPLMLVNARMNEKSLRDWRRRPDTARWLLGRFGWIGAADSRTRDGLEDVTGHPVVLAGNLKLEARPLPAPPEELARLVDRLGNRPVWLAASTHEGEDAIVLDAHRRLLEDHPDALLILAPRHPERAGAVARDIADRGLSAERRSHGTDPDRHCQVWLADTLGEMALWYALAPAALIAGSLLPGIGGHNPVEASQAGAAAITGPHAASFDDLYAAYRRHGAVIEVHDAPTLAGAVARIWRGEGPPAAAAQAAIAEASSGAMRTTLDALLERLPEPAP
jgi:3-deoxy-D-manno-octulosonic-acid transferase